LGGSLNHLYGTKIAENQGYPEKKMTSPFLPYGAIKDFQGLLFHVLKSNKERVAYLVETERRTKVCKLKMGFKAHLKEFRHEKGFKR
jgi:hypothetical protein